MSKGSCRGPSPRAGAPGGKEGWETSRALFVPQGDFTQVAGSGDHCHQHRNVMRLTPRALPVPWTLGSMKLKPQFPALDEEAECLCHSTPVPGLPRPCGPSVCMSRLGTGPGGLCREHVPFTGFHKKTFPQACHELSDVTDDALETTRPSFRHLAGLCGPLSPSPFFFPLWRNKQSYLLSSFRRVHSSHAQVPIGPQQVYFPS